MEYSGFWVFSQCYYVYIGKIITNLMWFYTENRRNRAISWPNTHACLIYDINQIISPPSTHASSILISIDPIIFKANISVIRLNILMKLSRNIFNSMNWNPKMSKVIINKVNNLYIIFFILFAFNIHC